MAEALQYSWRKKDIATIVGTTSTGDLLADEDLPSIEQDLGIRCVIYQGSRNTWIVSQDPIPYPSSASILTAWRAFNIHRPPRKIENYQLPFFDDPLRYIYDPDELSIVHLDPFAPGAGEVTEFKLQIVIELDSEAVEDGVVHTVEVAIQRALNMYPQHVATWVEELFVEMLAEKKLAYASGLLQCLGRLKPDKIKNVTKSLVIKGLSEDSVELREAAITVIEQWGGDDMLNILREHHDPVPWLAHYAQQVIQDLSESG